MWSQEREELEIEWNSRYDYQAELAAEHAESPETLASEAEGYAEEAQREWEEFIGPRQPRAVRVLEDDEIPF